MNMLADFKGNCVLIAKNIHEALIYALKETSSQQ